MNLTNKQELIIKLFCILILIGLNIAVWYNGKDLSCSQCIIKFSSGQYNQLQKDIDNSFNVSVIELYESYQKDYCLVKYIDNQGFSYANFKN